MHSENIYNLIKFDEYSVTPKYRQLVNCILQGVKEGKIGKDYVLPSINDLGFETELSRKTVEKAYRYLKQTGIINSIPGKGYYIAQTDFKSPLKVFLLFNKLSPHKKIIYDAFAATLGDQAVIDFYIYNNDFSLFKKLLKERREGYAYYVIIPHFDENAGNATELINSIPKDKLVLLSKSLPGVEGDYAAIYEDFKKDIYSALKEGLNKLKKYRYIKIIFPEYTYHSKEILSGFKEFCQDYAFEYEVIKFPGEVLITKETVYISLMEDDLVMLIKKILDSGLKVGEEVGVISYNETPIKQIILNGITTISSDFKMMGEQAAKIILNKSTEKVAIPFYLTIRDSL